MNSRGEPEGPGRVGLGRRDAQEPEPPATDAGLRYWSTRCATVTVRNHSGILDLSRGTHRSRPGATGTAGFLRRDAARRIACLSCKVGSCRRPVGDMIGKDPLEAAVGFPSDCVAPKRAHRMAAWPRMKRSDARQSPGRLQKTGGAPTYDFDPRSCRLTVIINFR